MLNTNYLYHIDIRGYTLLDLGSSPLLPVHQKVRFLDLREYGDAARGLSPWFPIYLHWEFSFSAYLNLRSLS